MEKNFDTYREKLNDLPRPGVKTLKEYFPYGERKVQWASTENIDKYHEIFEDFFQRIMSKQGIGIPFFISDESKLPTYEPREGGSAKKQREEIIKSVLEVYGIDITSGYDGSLYKIFELIKEKSNPQENKND